MVPVGDLEPHPDNPHQGDVEVIARSIEKNGFYGTVLVQASRMRIIAGEHRWRGAKTKGLGQVPALIFDVDDDTALRILLADNRTAEIGWYDDPALAELLRGLDDLDGTGWTEQDLRRPGRSDRADNAAVALAAGGAPAPGGGRADQAGSDARDEEEWSGRGDADRQERPAVWGVVVTCDTEAQQVQLLNQVAGQGWERAPRWPASQRSSRCPARCGGTRAHPPGRGAANQASQAVATLAGSTGPIVDTLLRFTGPAVQPSIGDVATGGWVLRAGGLLAGERLLIDCGRMQAAKVTTDTWDLVAGTDVTEEIDTIGPGSQFRWLHLAPAAAAGDPFSRAVLVPTSATGTDANSKVGRPHGRDHDDPGLRRYMHDDWWTWGERNHNTSNYRGSGSFLRLSKESVVSPPSDDVKCHCCYRQWHLNGRRHFIALRRLR
ncbi:ParB/RepB/Spo0J family partition protein [Nonomuraea sp. NPDC050786]|uniref:ParB/RepB/Spo0J family partition protein n=1 Tax=Nonomuraea sp. NPDC050786 TaxID=3154840 RepID=UPI0033E87DC5